MELTSNYNNLLQTTVYDHNVNQISILISLASTKF